MSTGHGSGPGGGLPDIYTLHAAWWPLFSSPASYAEEAAAYRDALVAASEPPHRTLLELGCGGGNNASYLKRDFDLTLTDLSPGMLEVSRALNPECDHVLGDMRTLRLGREFDRVLLHDAVVWMRSREDLRAALQTAFAHCRPGGAALFAPDHLKETFSPRTSHGGHDGDDGRSLRYLKVQWDPDEADSTLVVDFAFMLRDPEGRVELVHDRHVEGVFSRDEWIELLEEVGFVPSTGHLPESLSSGSPVPFFLGVRPG